MCYTRKIALSLSVGLMASTLILTCLTFASHMFATFDPVRAAAVSIPERDITVELELYSASPLGKGEYNRRLTVWNGAESETFDLYIDWGGADRVALYFDGVRCLTAVSVVDTIRVDLDGLTNPGSCQGYRLPKTLNTGHYLGAFMLFSTYPDGERQHHFDFVPRALLSECIETLMEPFEGEPADPVGRFHPHCPDFAPDVWPSNGQQGAPSDLSRA